MNTSNRLLLLLSLTFCLMGGIAHAAPNDVVGIGDDASLETGRSANAVVAILGDATSAGEVHDSVVAVLGDTHVTGPVGNAVVAVLGNSYIDSRVERDVVTVGGDLTLGPHAEIGGSVVAVGGTLHRDPAAIIHGGVPFGSSQGLRSWMANCLRYVRPLALAPHLEWAWGLALGFLALYVLLALMFRSGVERCVETLETHPGRTILAALLALLLTPVLFLLLFITVIGIAAIPFVGVAIFCATLFGKTAMLAWLGGQLTKSFKEGPLAQPVFSVLVGGLVVLALYLVPVVGFIVYKLLGLLALGIVVYTLILAAGNRKPAVAAAAPAGAPPPASPDSAGTISAPSPPPQPTETAALPRAGFWIRIGALLLDLILVSILLGLIEHHPGPPVLLALAIYGAIMWKLKGSTIGGIICGLKVVRLDGRPIDWPTAVVRALGCFLSLVVMGLGFFWIVLDDGRQAWHDKIAGTVVVRMPKGASLV